MTALSDPQLLSAAIATATFAYTLLLIKFLTPFSVRLGLVSCRPSEVTVDSKPVVGGVVIFLAVTAAIVLSPKLTEVEGISPLSRYEGFIVWTASAWLVLIGHLDDRYQLPITLRLAGETLAALAFCLALDVRLSSAGDLFGLGDIQLPEAVSLFTSVLFIVGISNAYNMLDGMDGLMAGLTLSLLVICWIFVEVPVGVTGLILTSSLLAFLVSNLGLWKHIPAIYLGDGGSKPLGFIVACLLLSASSSQLLGKPLLPPVTASFLIALPAFDMIYTIGARLCQKKSPLIGDHSHIHHALLKLGLPARLVLFFVLGLSCLLSAVGLSLNHLMIKESSQLAVLVLCFFVFCLWRFQLHDGRD